MKLTTLLVCDASLDQRQTIEDLIRSQPSLALIGTIPAAMARQQIGNIRPKVVWIELSPTPTRRLALLAELREVFPKTYFLVSHEAPDSEFIRIAATLGATGFLDAERDQTDLRAIVKSIRLSERAN